jgi:two-component sensor histidine kinase
MFRFTSLPGFDATLPMWRAWAVLGIGLLLSALAGLIAAVIGFQREMAVEAKEQARVLARELSHRAKNTLSIVTAIASQTARHSSSLQQFDRAFRDRLKGLSNVHDLLASGQANATSLHALVAEVLRPYRSADAANLYVKGPDALIPSNTAIMLSVILNELATNAMKYGAWSAPSGRVRLTWEVDRNAYDGLLRLTWIENGGPPVAPPQREGFGTSVMKFAVERSLGGSTRTEWRREGAIYEIAMPYGMDAGDAAEAGPGTRAAS